MAPAWEPFFCQNGQITLFRFKVSDLLMNVEKNEKIKNCTFLFKKRCGKPSAKKYIIPIFDTNSFIKQIKYNENDII